MFSTSMMVTPEPETETDRDMEMSMISLSSRTPSTDPGRETSYWRSFPTSTTTLMARYLGGFPSTRVRCRWPQVTAGQRGQNILTSLGLFC